ncbi:MAG: ComEC/Rec2 family competence protein [bacterium]
MTAPRGIGHALRILPNAQHHPAQPNAQQQPSPVVRRRGVWAFGAITLGIAGSTWWPPTSWPGVAEALAGGETVVPGLGAGVAVAAVLAGAQRGRWACGWLFVALALLAAGYLHARVRQADASSLAHVISMTAGQPPGPLLLQVRGVVVGTPEIGQAPSPLDDWVRPGSGRQPVSPRLRMDVDVTHVAPLGDQPPRWTPASGLVRVSVPTTPSGGDDRPLTQPPTPGTVVMVSGGLRAVFAAPGPGVRDAAQALSQDHRVGVLLAESAGAVRTGTPETWPERVRGAWLGGLHQVRAAARATLLPGDGPTEPGRALLAALVLGVEDPALAEVQTAFAHTGLVHVLSISGFHLAVAVGLMLVALRAVVERPRAEAAAAALAVLLYVAVVPMSTPLLRSALMVLAMLAAEAAGRRYDRLNTLAWVAVAALVWRPWDLFSAGFQLSFGVTAALVAFGPALAARFGTPRRPLRGLLPGPGDQADAARRWAIKSVGGLVVTCTLAWAISLPAVAEHTGRVSLLGVPASAVMIPPISAALGLGIAGVTLSAVGGLGALLQPLAAAGGVLLWLADELTGWCVVAAQWLDAPWAAPPVPLPGPVLTALTTLALWWLARSLARKMPAAVPAAAAALALAMCVAWPTWRTANQPHTLTLTQLAVNAGRCSIITTPEGCVLVDAGSHSAGTARRLGLDVARAVQALGGYPVQALVLTAADPTSAAGAVEVVQSTGAGLVLVAPAIAELAERVPDSAARRLLEALRATGARVEVIQPEEMHLVIGRASLHFAPPDRDGRVGVELRTAAHRLQLEQPRRPAAQPTTSTGTTVHADGSLWLHRWIWPGTSPRPAASMAAPDNIGPTGEGEDR